MMDSGSVSGGVRSENRHTDAEVAVDGLEL